MHDDHIFRVLEILFDPDGPEIVSIGLIPSQCLAGWRSRATDEVVITRNRRNHYLSNHPEMHHLEDRLLKSLLDPDEVHVNRNDRQIAIVYGHLEGAHWLRTAMFVSGSPDLKNSVLSSRIARQEEVEEGRRSQQRVWGKK